MRTKIGRRAWPWALLTSFAGSGRQRSAELVMLISPVIRKRHRGMDTSIKRPGEVGISSFDKEVTTLKTKLFISNLAYRTGEDTVRQLFERFGIVKFIHILTDRDTGRSRGFGFLEMSDHTSAQKAMDSLNGRDVEGRAIRIDWARPPKEERPR
jgi:RNA recognition motif-containing protein